MENNVIDIEELKRVNDELFKTINVMSEMAVRRESLMKETLDVILPHLDYLDKLNEGYKKRLPELSLTKRVKMESLIRGNEVMKIVLRSTCDQIRSNIENREILKKLYNLN